MTSKHTKRGRRARRIADEAAEHERVALEMERAPKRSTKAKRTGKGKRRVAAKGGR